MLSKEVELEQKIQQIIKAEMVNDYGADGQIIGDKLSDAGLKKILWLTRPEPSAPVAAVEDAIFAKGYRSGYFDGSGGITAFQSEVKEAHERWETTGRKTHLDFTADALGASAEGKEQGGYK